MLTAAVEGPFRLLGRYMNGKGVLANAVGTRQPVGNGWYTRNVWEFKTFADAYDQWASDMNTRAFEWRILDEASGALTNPATL